MSVAPNDEPVTNVQATHRQPREVGPRMPPWEKMTWPSPRVEQALVERELFLAWLPVGRNHIELMSLESDPRWPAFIEKVKAAVQAGASATI